METKKSYDESSIKHLSLIEGIRLRPSTFINGGGPDAVLKLIYEPLQNANDEASIGEANKIEIVIDSKTPHISVSDNGRGIPIGAVDKIVNNIYSGGKYNENAYSVHSGANGMGLMVLNCLSEKMEMIIKRDSKIATIKWENGIKVSEDIKDYKEKDTGTKISFKPYLVPFFGPGSGFEGSTDYVNIEKFLLFIEGVMFCNKGVCYEVTYDGKKQIYFFNGSDKEYLSNLAKREKIKLLWDDCCTYEIENKLTAMYGKVVVSFNKESTPSTWSYVNRFPTIEDGMHVDGAKSGISRAITQYIKQNDYAPKTSKFTVTGADVIDNISIIVLSEMTNPLFDGQTKNRLTSKDAFDFFSINSYNNFITWANTHREEMDKLCKLAVLKAKATFAAKEAKEQTMNPVSVKNVVSSKLNLKKFTDCSGNNPKENELYICEGDSATGSLVLSRDAKTQAYLALRGKILNVTGKKNPALTEELQMLISVLGIRGRGQNADYSKMRYNRVIIMADSDPDGSHISSLILGFFLAFFPKLIENGHVFIATPPFYRLNYPKNVSLNILNETYFSIYKLAIANKAFDLLDSDNKIIDHNVARVFNKKLEGYNVFLEAFAKELNLDCHLLEMIVRCFESLIKKNYKQFETIGYNVKLKTENKNYRIYYFDKGYDHYFLKVDSKFYNKIYIPIYKRLCDIKLGNVKYRNKKTKEEYSGTLYHLSNCLDKMLVGSKCKLERYKGLGEINSNVLRETAMDPKTRKIVQVTMNNVQSAIKWAGILLGDDNINIKKDLFMED
ncbi:MAG: toprim domain-containing protein [Anaeroplasmataceae bacterium]